MLLIDVQGSILNMSFVRMVCIAVATEDTRPAAWMVLPQPVVQTSTAAGIGKMAKPCAWAQKVKGQLLLCLPLQHLEQQHQRRLRQQTDQAHQHQL